MPVLTSRLQRCLCLDDFEEQARRHLPRSLFAYVSGAVERNASLRDNRDAFAEYGFVTRIMRDVAKVDTGVELLGRRHGAPFGIAPMGLLAMSAYDGDAVLARAARQADIPMVLSGSSLMRMEDVRREGDHVWFQAYLPGKEDQIHALIQRARDCAFDTLVVTVDTPAAANRENNVRAGFSTPLRPSARLFWDGVTHPAWTFGTFLRTLRTRGMPHFENNYAHRGVPVFSSNVQRDFSDRGHLDWRHFRMVRDLWPGRIVMKGILSVDDARLAVEHGADGIVLSNHGGRQLDGAVAPLRVLDEVVQALPAQVPVMLDSGVRRGTDVLKALALGARFVFVGRPFCYAAAIGGEAGALQAATLLQSEVRRNMAMLGVTALAELDRSALRHIGR